MWSENKCWTSLHMAVLFLNLSGSSWSGFFFSLEKKHRLLMTWPNLEIIKLHPWYRIQMKYTYKRLVMKFWTIDNFTHILLYSSIFWVQSTRRLNITKLSFSIWGKEKLLTCLCLGETRVWRKYNRQCFMTFYSIWY